MRYPSVDDLRLAATWLENYEAGPDGDGRDQVEACRRVAALLDRLADSRERTAGREAVVRTAVAATGRSAAEVRAAMKRIERRKRGAACATCRGTGILNWPGRGACPDCGGGG